MLKVKKTKLIGKDVSLNEKKATLRASCAQECSVVGGFEGLVAQKYCSPQSANAASLVKKKGHATVSRCAPFASDQRACLLLWGAGQADNAREEKDYNPTPLDNVHFLLAANFKRDIGASGAIFKGRPLGDALRNARETYTCRDKHLHFVYDIVGARTSFNDLKFTRDAGIEPLASYDDENFMRAYGIPRRLLFKRAEPRLRKPTDWWAVYA